MLKTLSVFGTRPEAIKMAPVLQSLALNSDRVESVVCVTAQHREMLDQVLELFAIAPDIDLDLMEGGQTPASVTSAVLTGLTDVLERVQPDLVLVQGDTTTSMVAALAGFYQRVPVAHVEAGLRTFDRYSPFPEEINRRITGVLASLHFAPTARAAEALRGEGVPQDSIHVPGNTVIDALLWVVQQPPSAATAALLRRLGIGAALDVGGEAGGETVDGDLQASPEPSVILVTAHRRENFGAPLESICAALSQIVQRNTSVQIVYPVHMNPNVSRTVYRLLGRIERIHLLDPLPYETFAHVMKHARLILTDSGGIQEEAPALGKPVLVMRRETERPEGVEAGCVRLVGTESENIVTETERLLHDVDHYQRMARAVSPYGDGHAAERIVNVILDWMS